MNVLIIAVLFVAQLSTSHAKTCAECGTDYGTAKGAAGSDNPAKCKAIKDFLTCLSTATECPLDATNAGLIESDHTAIASDCPLSDVCTCQKTFFETDQTANAAAECSAVTAYFACLRGKTDAACDDTTKVSGLATEAVTFIPNECTAKTDTCDCQIEFMKTDMADDTKKCTAAKNYVSCLVGKTAGGCDTSVDVKTLAGDAKAITDTEACSTTDVCDCEITYATAEITASGTRCTATKALTTCIQTSINDGCGASTTKTDVGKAAQAVFTALTSCTVTPTCQCQVDFNKADVTSSNKCTSATAFDTCLNAIDSTTETGCDGSTKTTALTPDMKTKVKDVLCSTAGPGLKSAIGISLVMLMVSALFISP